MIPSLAKYGGFMRIFRPSAVAPSATTSVLVFALLFVLGSATTVSAQSARGALPDPETFSFRDLTHELSNKMTGAYTITTVGDVLMMEPVSKMIDPKIQQLLRDADTAIGNMEVTIVDRRNWTAGFAANFSPPQTAADVAALGFDLMNGANNHAFDMGEEGLQSSARWLADQGIPLAGVGPTLSTARMPVFQLTSKGRVGLIGAYTNAGASAASDKMGNMGYQHWGVNPVRLTTWNVVTRPQLEYLRSIRDEIVARRSELTDSAPIAVPKNDPDRVQIFNDNYTVGPKVGEYRYEINNEDLQANLLAIRNTKENADFAVFTMHAHQNRYAFQQVYVDHYPGQFIIDFAHALIDNGADIYLGHGEHSLQGIEIYKGRPIFYDLGAFMLQEITVDGSDLPSRMTSIEADELPTDRLQTPDVLVAVVATSRYQDGKLVEVRLTPVELGVGKNRPWSRMGIPQTPPPELAQEILTKVQEYSQPFHTRISIEKGIGVIRIPPDATLPVGAGIRSTFTVH
jgi:poly-gamma-glutamate capsule biosynthesis protein CapA/YwtB (metallophosphatase superfamily)